MKINAHIIASGSKGNAVIVYSDKTTLLFDLGILKNRLIEGLEEINKSIKDIDYAFFTHSHSDHIKSFDLIEENKRYALSKTIPLDRLHTLKNFKEKEFNEFKITPLKTSHDTLTPCGFLITLEEESLAFITDTGIIPKATLELIKNKDYYYFESNYDEEMLLNSGRPGFLINRIMGKKGHLSNKDSAYYLSTIIGDKTKKIVLAHLSEECNDEALALETHYDYYNKIGLDVSGIEIKCAKQYESIDL